MPRGEIKRFFSYCLFLGPFLASGCAEEPKFIDRVVRVRGEPRKVDYSHLSEAEISYIERFNVTAKSIRDFPPNKEKLAKYFHIFKNVADLKDAQFLLFGEQHNNSASQLWTAGAMNELVETGSIMLFEGNQSRLPIPDIEEHVVHDIFAAREFELRKIEYTPTSIMKLRKKFQTLFNMTQEFLSLNILNFYKAKAYFWDLRDNKKLRPRNEEMVQTMQLAQSGRSQSKIFVIAGARHLPQYEFATFLFEYKGTKEYRQFIAAGGREHQLDDVFFNTFRNSPKIATTKSIYDFLKYQRYAILIPKNMPNTDYIKPYFPTSY